MTALRVAIAGATGLIGRSLTHALLARGDEVHALTRDEVRAGEVLPPRARIAAWDPADPGSLRRTLTGLDAVVNLAGEPVMAKRWNDAVKERLRTSRIESTRTIVRAMRDCRPAPGVLVNASAIDIYPPRETGAVTEGDAPGDSFLARLCADWEAEAAEAARDGARVVTVRIGLVLSRDGGALPRMLPPFRFFVGGRIGHGRQGVSWIHLADLTALFLFALDRDDLRGPLNGTAPAPVTNAAFARALGRAVRRPAWLPVPGLVVRLLVGEGASLVLAGRRAVPRRALDAGFTFRFPDLDSALRDLFPPD